MATKTKSTRTPRTKKKTTRKAPAAKAGGSATAPATPATRGGTAGSKSMNVAIDRTVVARLHRIALDLTEQRGGVGRRVTLSETIETLLASYSG